MKAFVKGVGLLGPGLDGWAASRATLAGTAAYVHTTVAVPAAETLPAAERRRVGTLVKIALAVGGAACADAGWPATSLVTVFTSSGGDGDNLNHLCETLASRDRDISPTRFHNSVHNAAAGYWTIAARSHAASTSLCGHDGGFAAGLLEAVAQVAATTAPVLLIAYDTPYPEPLNAVRPISAMLGIALVLTAAPAGAHTALTVSCDGRNRVPHVLPEPGLEALRTGVPAGRGLPLLAALARGEAAAVVLEYLKEYPLIVEVSPC